MVRLRSTERRGLVPTIQEPYQPITLITKPPRTSNCACVNNRMTTFTKWGAVVELLPVFRSLTTGFDLMYIDGRLDPTRHAAPTIEGQYHIVRNGFNHSSLPVTTLRKYNSLAYLGKIVSDTTSLISWIRANWKRKKEYRCPLSKSLRVKCAASCATVPIHKLPKVKSISAKCSFVQPHEESISQ